VLTRTAVFMDQPAEAIATFDMAAALSLSSDPAARR
jgi:hypothetical protein